MKNRGLAAYAVPKPDRSAPVKNVEAEAKEPGITGKRKLSGFLQKQLPKAEAGAKAKAQKTIALAKTLHEKEHGSGSGSSGVAAGVPSKLDAIDWGSNEL